MSGDPGETPQDRPTEGRQPSNGKWTRWEGEPRLSTGELYSFYEQVKAKAETAAERRAVEAAKIGRAARDI